MREDEFRLDDIRSCCEKIVRFTSGMEYDQFEVHEVVFDAVMHNLMIIGEASNHISHATQQQFPSIEWRKLTGLRNIIAHEYFGIDTDIIWDVVQNKIPELLLQLRDIGLPGEK